MKAFLFIVIFFVSFPLFYLGYLNLVNSGSFDKVTFTATDGNNYELVVFETAKFSFIEDNSQNTFILSPKDGTDLSLPTSTGNLKDFFSEWSRLGGADGLQENLGSPKGCNYINFVIKIDTSSKKLSDNLERAYCTVNSEPNFSFIP